MGVDGIPAVGRARYFTLKDDEFTSASPWTRDVFAATLQHFWHGARIGFDKKRAFIDDPAVERRRLNVKFDVELKILHG